MQIKVVSHKFRDIEEVFFENKDRHARYPQFVASLALSENIRREGHGGAQTKEISPTKADIRKKVEEAKLTKAQSTMQPKQEVEEDKQEDEKLEDDSFTEELDQNLASQQLSNNEICFIGMFILITEARLKHLKPSGTNSSHLPNRHTVEQNLKIQNFIESVLIVFNNYAIDQENLHAKLDHIVKVVIIDYLNTIRELRKSTSNQIININHIVSKDM